MQLETGLRICETAMKAPRSVNKRGSSAPGTRVEILQPVVKTMVRHLPLQPMEGTGELRMLEGSRWLPKEGCDPVESSQSSEVRWVETAI